MASSAFPSNHKNGVIFCIYFSSALLAVKMFARLQRLNRFRKNALSDLQGLKPLKKMQTLCRAYPSFVGMKRHDPQNLRLFPQPVKPTKANLASAGLKPGPPAKFKNSTRCATNFRISCTDGTDVFTELHPAPKPQPHSTS